MELPHVILGLAALPMVLVISRYYAMALWHLVWRPYAVTRSLGLQGIRGPPYTFAIGSLKECKRMVVAGRAKPIDASCHNYTSLVQPFFQKCTSHYGKTFLFWIGPIPSICSTDIELVKEVLADRANIFQKDYLNPSLEVFFGKGLILTNGDDWKRHRKVVHPVFNQEKLKVQNDENILIEQPSPLTEKQSLSALASEGAKKMMDEWSTKIQMSNTYKTEVDMRSYSEDLAIGVIEGVIFGQKTKESGEVFVALKELEKLAVQAILAPPIPGFRYLPTDRNRRTWKLDKLVTSKIMHVMETRLANNSSCGEDLLGLMIRARGSGANTLSNEEIVGECKTFFAAGTITSATLLSWAMFLISLYPQWKSSVNAMRKNKLNMVLLETLRLYNPVPFVTRRVASDTILKKIKVPKGTVITIPIAMLHRDKEVWGPDSDEFNPMRFQNGISRAAKYANSLLAFSSGPRICSGQNIAMIQVQTVMAMILRRFSFSLSPSYVHKPTNLIALKPKYGLPLVVRNLFDGQHNSRGVAA